MEACTPRQENVAIVATQTLGGGVFSGKYLYERNQWDRVSFVLFSGVIELCSVMSFCYSLPFSFVFYIFFCAIFATCVWLVCVHLSFVKFLAFFRRQQNRRPAHVF